MYEKSNHPAQKELFAPLKRWIVLKNLNSIDELNDDKTPQWPGVKSVFGNKYDLFINIYSTEWRWSLPSSDKPATPTAD